MIWPFTRRKKIVIERMRLGLFGDFCASPKGFAESREVEFGLTREDAIRRLILLRPDLADAKVEDRT